MRKRNPETRPVWQPPTRRMFVAMLGAAAAAFVVKEPPVVEKPRSAIDRITGGKTRWVGHC